MSIFKEKKFEDWTVKDMGKGIKENQKKEDFKMAKKYTYTELSPNAKLRAFVSIQNKLKNSLGSGFPVTREMVEEQFMRFAYLRNGSIYERGY